MRATRSDAAVGAGGGVVVAADVVVAAGLRVDGCGTGVRANDALSCLARRRLGLALEVAVVVALGAVLVLAAGELALELVHRDGREDGRLVDDRRLVDLLVNGDNVVDDLVLVCVALDDGRHVLMNLRAQGG
jgi:hypothetical protein